MASDLELVEKFVDERSESAFAELVSRHVDLVYSTALRLVGGDCHLAEDISQTVFADFARKASGLPRSTLVPVWLYRSTRYASANVVRTERRRKKREIKAMELQNQASSENALWEKMAPHLDEAMDQLNPVDHYCILLRFLKKHDLRTVGDALGISEDAAQKRVSRAILRLRKILLRQDISASGTLLSSALILKGTTSAPTGLAASIISSSLNTAPIAGISWNIVQIMTATKIKFGMVSTITILSLLSPLIIHQRAQSVIQEQHSILRAQEDQLALREARNNRFRINQASPHELPSSETPRFRELLKLRGKVGVLRTRLANLKSTADTEALENARHDMLTSLKSHYADRVRYLKELLDFNPLEKIPELRLLTEEDWLNLVGQPYPDSKQGRQQAMSRARTMAESEFGNRILKPALKSYLQQNENKFPDSVSDLKPFYKEPVDEDILERWIVLPTSDLVIPLRGDFSPDTWVITVKAPINRDLDQRYFLGATKAVLFADAPPHYWDTQKTH